MFKYLQPPTSRGYNSSYPFVVRPLIYCPPCWDFCLKKCSRTKSQIEQHQIRNLHTILTNRKRLSNSRQSPGLKEKTSSPNILLMEEILHQLIWYISHYLQDSIHPRWCRISSINSISRILTDRFRTILSVIVSCHLHFKVLLVGG